MTSVYIIKQSFIIHKTDVGIQKINNSTLVTYKMVIAGFSIQKKLRKDLFSEKTFLLAKTSIEMVLEMLFFTFLM